MTTAISQETAFLPRLEEDRLEYLQKDPGDAAFSPPWRRCDEPHAETDELDTPCTAAGIAMTSNWGITGSILLPVPAALPVLCKTGFPPLLLGDIPPAPLGGSSVLKIRFRGSR